MKKRIKMYGGKPKPNDAPKTNKAPGFWAKRKTKKISKETIHIAKEISKLKGNIEISKAKKPPGTYVSKKKQRQINELIGELGKLSAKSAEIHKENILKETQSPKQGEPSKALESLQTQRANTKLQSAFQTKVESELSQKQFNSQTMYRSKQKYINSTKEALSIEREKLLGEKAKLDLEIAAEKEAEKTKPQGEPNKPGFFSKISSLFKMKKKTTKNKLNNIEAKLNNLTKTQNSVDKYEREQNNAYYAKQDNYAERLKILKTIPTATAKSNVPTNQTASTKAQTATSTKLQQTTPKNKKQAKEQIAETQKIVEGETIKLREATEKVTEINDKLTNTKPDYAIALTKLSEIELILKNDKKTEKDLKTELETLSETIKSKPNIDTTSPEFIKYNQLKDDITRIESKNILTQKEMRIAQEKVNEEVNKQIDLEKELEAAKTIKFDAEQTVQAAKETLTQAETNLFEVSKTKKERQADKKQKEANAATLKAKQEADQAAATLKAKQEAEQAAAIKKAEEDAKKAEEDAKKANEAFKKTLPGLEKKREDIAKKLDTLQIEQTKAVGAFNIAKQNKSDADKLVSINTNKLNTIINDEKENFKARFKQRFGNNLSLDGTAYLKAEAKHINAFKSSTNEIVDLRRDLEDYKENAIEENKIYAQASKNKYNYLVQIKNTKKDLASLDEQIEKFIINTNTA